MVKSDNSLAIVAVVGIVALILFLGSNSVNPSTGLPWFGWNFTQPTPYPTPTPSVAPTPTPFRPNLQSLFVAVTTILGADGNCTAAGGTWSNTPQNVGCWGTAVPINTTLVCSNPLIVVSEGQCSTVGAVWTCDTNSAGCRYV